LEQGLGTDSNSADTDGDGYNDYNEIRDGYNPLGAGKTKFDNNFSKTDLNFDREPLSKLKSHSDWISTKKSYIKEANNHGTFNFI
jgi:hypothetical protein